LKQQQLRLKANQIGKVIEELTKLETIEKVKNAQAANKSVTKQEQPVSACRRYIENRLEYLDYKTTLKAGLPISSGETESGHRWVIQARLKIAGAWWTIAGAQRMLKLRTMRASGGGESYWRRISQTAA